MTALLVCCIESTTAGPTPGDGAELDEQHGEPPLPTLLCDRADTQGKTIGTVRKIAVSVLTPLVASTTLKDVRQ